MLPSIRVQAVAKRYRRGARSGISTLQELLSNVLMRTARADRSGGARRDLFWALDDVTFDVGRGEVIGIVGRNGAGKSTLLKVLSRITEPTKGRVEIRGRVASLLEVGTGFHGDLTGRENIYINGAILGMHRGEIRRRFDEIVSFAEIESFVDTPVKRYSTGMYLRLAFAVAAHLQPEILLVDEVLAVGDFGFQQKCLGKISEVSTQGRTVLFVSHNLAVIRSLCARCLLLEAGRLAADGDVNDIINKYVAGALGNGERSARSPVRRTDVAVQATCMWFESEQGERVSSILMGSDTTLVVDYFLQRDARSVTLAVLISANDVPLLYSYDTDADESLRHLRPAGRYRARVPLPLCRFKEGTYVVRLKIGYGKDELTDPDAYLVIEIRNENRDLTHMSFRRDRPGYLLQPIAWTTERLDN